MLLQAGMCVRSRLGEGDRLINNRTPYEEFRIALNANETVQIDMDAIPDPNAWSGSVAEREVQQGSPITYAQRGFDTYLELRVEGEEQPIQVNDDRPDSLNSRLIFTPPQTGIYIIRARSLFLEGGDYILSVSFAVPLPEPLPFNGARAEGVIGPDAGRSDISPDYRAVRHAFDGTPGERARIDLQATGPDAQLRLVDPQGRTIAAASPVENGLTRLIAILPQEGRYLVIVDARAEQPLRYTLQMERVPPVPVHRNVPNIVAGEAVDQDLTLTSNVSFDEGSTDQPDFFFDTYSMEVDEGVPVTVTVEALDGDFYPILDIGAMSVVGFAAAMSGFDPEGTAAQLTANPIEPGRLVIRVRSLGLGLGRYRLLAVTGEPDPEAPR